MKILPSTHTNNKRSILTSQPQDPPYRNANTVTASIIYDER